jgi:hypothetical protein
MLVVLLIVDIIKPLLFNLKHSLSTTPCELWGSDLAVALHGKSIALHMHCCNWSWQMAYLFSDKLDIISHHLKSFTNHRIKRFSLSILGLIHRQDYCDHSESHSLKRIIALRCPLIKRNPQAIHFAIPLKGGERFVHDYRETYPGHVLAYNFFEDVPHRYWLVFNEDWQLDPRVFFNKNLGT